MKRIPMLIFIICLMLLPVSAEFYGAQSGTCGSGVSWSLESVYNNGKSEGALTISGSGRMDDYSRVAAPWSVYAEDITSVAVLPGVTCIGEDAFSGLTCLREATLADTVTSIGDGAFEGCSCLQELTLPAYLTRIPAFAFSRCSALTRIFLPNSLRSVDYAAFYGCTALNEVHYYGGDRSALHLELRNEALEAAVWYTGGFHMQGQCGPDAYWELDNDGVLTISGSGDMDCYGWAMLPGEYPKAPWYPYRKMVKSAVVTGISRIGSSAFSDCILLEDIYLHDSLAALGYNAFSGCSSLRRISIPDSVSDIGYIVCPDGSIVLRQWLIR